MPRTDGRPENWLGVARRHAVHFGWLVLPLLIPLGLLGLQVWLTLGLFGPERSLTLVAGGWLGASLPWIGSNL